MFNSLKNKTLLIVEDEIHTAKSFERKFKKFFQKVYLADNGKTGYETYLKHSPNAILTDITMPKLDGISMVKKIRKTDTTTPISILTAHKTVELLHNAIPLKLDHYIHKPIMKEDLTQYLNNLNESFSTQEKGMIQIDEDHSYNYETKELTYKNKTINLSYYETELLELFVKNINVPVSYEKIKEVTPKETSSNALRVFVSRFRAKKHNLKIKTITNLGYKLQS